MADGPRQHDGRPQRAARWCFKCPASEKVPPYVSSRDGPSKPYCRGCLVAYVSKNVKDAALRACGIPSEEPLAVFVSGGASSMVLLDVIARIRDENSARGGAGAIRYDVRAVHVVHDLPPGAVPSSGDDQPQAGLTAPTIVPSTTPDDRFDTDPDIAYVFPPRDVAGAARGGDSMGAASVIAACAARRVPLTVVSLSKVVRRLTQRRDSASGGNAVVVPTTTDRPRVEETEQLLVRLATLLGLVETNETPQQPAPGGGVVAQQASSSAAPPPALRLHCRLDASDAEAITMLFTHHLMRYLAAVTSASSRCVVAADSAMRVAVNGLAHFTRARTWNSMAACQYMSVSGPCGRGAAGDVSASPSSSTVAASAPVRGTTCTPPRLSFVFRPCRQLLPKEAVFYCRAQGLPCTTAISLPGQLMAWWTRSGAGRVTPVGSSINATIETFV